MSTQHYFPVAGCPGSARPDLAPYDKRWLVVDEQGRWLSPEACPRLGEVDVGSRLGYLVLKANGMLRLDLPLDVIEDDDSVRCEALVGTQNVDAVDEGQLAATWFSTFLGRSCRLLKVHPEAGAIAWPET